MGIIQKHFIKIQQCIESPDGLLDRVRFVSKQLRKRLIQVVSMLSAHLKLLRLHIIQDFETEMLEKKFFACFQPRSTESEHPKPRQGFCLLKAHAERPMLCRGGQLTALDCHSLSTSDHLA